jgi:lambda family phage portal protein
MGKGKSKGKGKRLRDDREFARRTMARFEAAEDTRRTSGWRTNNSGPNSDLRQAYYWLVKRHQDLADNDAYASRAIGVIVNNWIGDGIMSTPTGATSKYKSSWKTWAESRHSDFYGTHDWYGNQSVGARTTAVRGAVLVRKRIYPELFERYGIAPLQVQMLEPDWLDFNKDNSQDILFGQQFDSAGRLMGYWIRDSHPGETSLGIGVRVQSTFVPKEEISLHFDCRRAGQRMGLPFGTAAILTLRDMGDIRAAQQMKDKISACFFGVSYDSDVNADKLLDENGNQIIGVNFDEIEPGAIEHLPPGRDFKAFTPPSSGDFVSTHREYAHAVAAAYEITYEALTGDLSDVNYSSFRGGWLEFSRRIAYLRGKVSIPGMLAPVCEWHDELARMVGLLKGPMSWTHTPPRREMIDPTKEIPALILAVRAGFMSLSEVQLSFGYVPEEVIEELSRDMQRARDASLILSTDAALVSNAGVTQARPAGSAFTNSAPDPGADEDGSDLPD